MRARSWGLLVMAALASGCLDVAPVAEPQGLPVNPAALGTWELQGDESARLVVLEFSATEYAVEYAYDNDSLYFRGYEVEVGDRRLLQLALIGWTPRSADPPDGRYCLVSYAVDGDELVLRLEGETCRGDEPSRWRRQGTVPPAPDAPVPATRQPEPGLAADEPVGAEVDLRIGTVRPLVADPPVSVGGRVSVYPWRDGPARRLSVQFAGDYERLGSLETEDTELGSFTLTTDHFYVLSLAAGVDVVRTPQVVLDVRAGPSWVGQSTTFSLEGNIVEYEFDDEEFQNVCGLVAFRDRCTDEIDFGGHLAVGLRVRPSVRWPLTVGVDFTYLTNGQRQIVGTIGLSSRR